MRKCYISKNYKRIHLAGNKAKTDIESAMASAGFINLGNKQTIKDNLITDYFSNLCGVTKAIGRIKKGDLIALQYPWRKYYDRICRNARKKGAKTVTIIHDLGAFRRKRLTIEQEIERLNQTDYIIAHNPNMKAWLEEHGAEAPIVCLEIFDYMSDSTPKENPISGGEYHIAYAGGLSPTKNMFLYHLLGEERPFKTELYGGGFEEDRGGLISSNYHYHGFVQSDELIANVEAHFGLVWDGDTMEGCGGTYGTYLRYNNPHKASLYVRCQLPIIVWNESGMAPFVKENNIGITVDSLDELGEILSSLTEEEYNKMKQATIEVSNRLNRGHYVTTALNKVVEIAKTED